jgi:hypothetical protein
VFGLSTASPGDDTPPPEITVVGPVTTSDAQLVHLEARRTGGVGYQDLSVTVDDPAVLAELQALVPLPLPQPPGPTGACADCWLYHVVLQYAGEQGALVLDYDQANEPPELAAFFDALDPLLEGNPTPPDSTSLDDVPPQGSMERIEVVRSGGFDGMTLDVTIDDPNELAVIAGLAPYPLPETSGEPTGCADCFVYRITVHYRGVDEPVVLEFDQSNAPPELAPFLGLVDSRLEAERTAG